MFAKSMIHRIAFIASLVLIMGPATGIAHAGLKISFLGGSFQESDTSGTMAMELFNDSKAADNNITVSRLGFLYLSGDDTDAITSVTASFGSQSITVNSHEPAFSADGTMLTLSLMPMETQDIKLTVGLPGEADDPSDSTGGTWRIDASVKDQAGTQFTSTHVLVFDVPELDPGSWAGAMILLGGGVLTLSGRRVCRRLVGQPDRPGAR